MIQLHIKQVGFQLISVVLWLSMIALGFPAIAQQCGCLNCGQPIPVFDTQLTVDYNVQGLVNDDLSGSQCVESVNLQFQHNRIQNMIVELIAPSGQSITLIGPTIPFGGGLNGTIGATWNVNFVQCFPNAFAAPDPFINEVWNNAEPGWNVFGGNFTGTYYPLFGNCLENFNFGTANGIWQLRITNTGFPPVVAPGLIESFSITFCDQTGLGCCSADGGTLLGSNAVQACVGEESLLFDNLSVSFSGSIPDPANYDYQYLLIRNDTIVQNGATLDLRNLPIGIYEIVGVSALQADMATILDSTTFSTIDFSALCASVARNNKTINISSPQNVSTQVSICSGQTFDFNGTPLTTSGLYQDTLQTTNSCDSIVELDLLVLDQIIAQEVAQVCFGETFDFNGVPLTTSGSYQDTLQTTSGCDSIVELDLLVLDQIVVQEATQICFGETFDFNGTPLTTSGSYQDTLQTTSGCDSIVELDLLVLDQIVVQEATQVCFGETFDFNGTPLTTSGLYQDTLQTTSGCDSIVELDLLVLDQIVAQEATQICFGETFDFNGIPLTTSGSYQDTLQTTSGCDSIVELDLLVLDQIIAQEVAQVCFGETFDFNGVPLTASGLYQDTLQTISGCDSIVELDLLVLDQIIAQEVAQVCFDETFDFNGTPLTASGSYQDTLQTTNGCDSIVELDLQVLDQIVVQEAMQICFGETFDFNGTPLTMSGLYQDTLQTISGCDSIVELDLLVLDQIVAQEVAQVCFGEMFDFNGTPLTTSGSYQDTLQTISSCDSIVELDLQVLDQIVVQEATQICFGETFDFNGTPLTTSGLYQDTLQTISGCDSIVELDLLVLDQIIAQEVAQVCFGETFDFNGTPLTTSGSYQDTLQTINGCDSIVELDLLVLDQIVVQEATQICFGETFDFNGVPLTTSGLYQDTLQTTSGCDSIVELDLAVIELPIAIQIMDTLNLDCVEEGLGLAIVEPSPNFTYNWTFQGSSIGNTPSIQVDVPGLYLLEIVDVETQCTARDSILVAFETNGIQSFSLNIEQSGCEPSIIYGFTIDDIVGGIPPYLYSFNQAPFTAFPNFSNLSPGNYELRIQDANGCERDTTFTIEPAPSIQLELGPDLTVRQGDSLQLLALINGDFEQIEWFASGKETLSCTDCLNPTVAPLQSTSYQAVVTTEAGCQISDELLVMVDQETVLYFPNAFSPNGDGNNDELRLFVTTESLRSIDRFSIFDRWGNLVIEQTDIVNFSDVLLWDGTSNGVVYNPGVYLYQAELQFADNRVEVLQGAINLIR